ncbi:hypothetical protein BASA81_005580 [Batrachochytrium salamandrivorans]|nr:hypothetical protein BASA81_005580 [Batrachochytrium salamandrivorans]
MGPERQQEQLEARFREAVLALSTLPVSQVSAKKKLLLFGLHSYVTKGELPAYTDLATLSKNKVEMIKRKAWLNASKMPVPEAMEAYCQLVGELTLAEPKTGVLYREHANGVWRKYHIELKDRLLSYNPANSANGTGGGVVFLMQGCVCTLEEPSSNLNPGSEFVRFSIAHPKSSKLFTVGAATKEQAQEWVDAIRLEANSKRALRPMFPTSSPESAGKRKSFLKSSLFLPITPSQEFGVPSLYAGTLDLLVDKFLRLTSDESQWQLFGEKHGMSTFVGVEGRESSMGDAVGVLGHLGQLNAPARCVFDLMWHHEQRNKVDPQMEAYNVVEELGKQTRVDHLIYSAVWPTSKRDFCRLSHYRVDESTGAVLIVAQSIEHVMCSPISSAVRAELLCTGFLIEPLLAGGLGCQVKYLIVLDPRVSSAAPKRFIQSVAANQTEILHRIATYLENNEFIVQSAIERGRMDRNPAAVLSLPPSPPPVLALSAFEDVIAAAAASSAALPVSRLRRRRQSTGNNSSLVFVKTEETSKKFVAREEDGDDGGEGYGRLAPWLALVALLYSSGTVPTVLLVVLAASAAAVTTRWQKPKRQFVSFTCVLPPTTQADGLVLALQRIINEDCPSLRGGFKFPAFSKERWVPHPRSQVLMVDLESLGKRGGWVLLANNGSLRGGSGSSSNGGSRRSTLDGFEEDTSAFNAVLVFGAQVFDHDKFTNRAVLFALQGDQLTCSVDTRCLRDAIKLQTRLAALGELHGLK